ncbi:MAG TPA: hypothetical protein VIO58_10600 [Candidatus Methanoperedens sp.]
MVNKKLLRNPFVFGVMAGILVMLFNILVASVAEGSLKSGYSVFLSNGIFVYLIPPAVAVQMGLFRYHRNLTTEQNVSGSEKMGMAGSATSSLAMIACCLHHVSDLLPAVGFIIATSSFLTQYKDAIIIMGLLANLAGSAYIARAVMKDKKTIAEAKRSLPESAG